MTDQWREHAACRGADPNLFIPDKGDVHAGYPAEIVAMCARCPVTEPCLAYALTLEGRLVGYWGGTTTRQRHEMLDRRERARAGQRARQRQAAAALATGAAPADVAATLGVTTRTVHRLATAAGR